MQNKHPAPVLIKYNIMAAMVQAGKDVDSITMSKMFAALDEGMAAAHAAHDKIMGIDNEWK